MLINAIILIAVGLITVCCGLNMVHKIPYLIAHLERYYEILIGFGVFGMLWWRRLRFGIIQNWLTYYGTRVHESATEKMVFLSGRKLFVYSFSHDGTGHIIYESDGAYSPFIILAPCFFHTPAWLWLVYAGP